MEYIKPERISLKLHPILNERWVQDRIAADPSILGLGDLVVRDKERRQPRAGRLDLLLQDLTAARRYEVEIQLGSTDESHIVRTLEYWDIERKRYPKYEHYAVLVAEDITSRFLNIVSLFNGVVPLIAIQMQALKFGDSVALVFTKVVDEFARGAVDEEDDAEATPTDRGYWEKRGTKATVQLADELLSLARSFDPSLEPKYNKFYIGISKDGQPFNFVVFRPRKANVNLEIKVPLSDEIDKQLDDAGVETLEYSARWGAYRLSLSKDDVTRHRELLTSLMHLAFQNRNS